MTTASAGTNSRNAIKAQKELDMINNNIKTSETGSVHGKGIFLNPYQGTAIHKNLKNIIEDDNFKDVTKNFKDGIEIINMVMVYILILIEIAKMNTKEVNERILELKALIKAQKKYNDFFCGNVIESRELQSNLSILQKPTITAIEKISIKPETIETRDITKFFLNEKVIPFIPEYLTDNIDAGGKLTQTIIPKFYRLNIVGVDKIKSFMEISLKENKIYLFSEDNNKNFLFTSEVIPYTDGIFRLILGNLDGTETLEDVEIYLNKFIAPMPTNSDYVNKLKKKFKRVDVNVKPKRKKKIIPTPLPEITHPPVEYKSEYSKSETEGESLNPLGLFEKLTLLISAAKSGHDNVDEEIKSVCKKLKTMGLISNKIYKKYKMKYFKL